MPRISLDDTSAVLRYGGAVDAEHLDAVIEQTHELLPGGVPIKTLLAISTHARAKTAGSILSDLWADALDDLSVGAEADRWQVRM